MNTTVPTKTFCTVIFSFLVGLSAGAAANWPTWRGPNRMGIAEGNPPLTWSEEHNIQWKMPLEGYGSNSTPAVWGEKLFFQIAVQTDKTPQPLPNRPAR